MAESGRLNPARTASRHGSWSPGISIMDQELEAAESPEALVGVQISPNPYENVG